MATALRVLFLATEWSSGFGGVNSFNRGLATAVAAIGGVKVTCALPTEPSPAAITDACKAGVRLICPGELPGFDSVHHLGRLLADMLIEYRPGSPKRLYSHCCLSGFKFHAIIGHGRWTGPAAAELARRLGTPVRVQVLHVNPNAIEQYKAEKGLPAGATADKRWCEEKAIARGANLRFAVGPRLADAYQALEPHMILPGLGPSLTMPSGQSRHALMLGRLEDEELKGIDLALHGLQIAAATGAVEFELRGALDERQVRQTVDRHLAEIRKSDPSLDHGRLRATVLPFATEQELLEDSFKRAQIVLMPSREEGFGLAGLEAIGFYRPVVASSRSGFAQVLAEVVAGDSALLESFVFEVEDDYDARTAARIAALANRFFDDPVAAVQKTRKIRKLLAPRCDWSKSAADLVTKIRAALSSANPPRRRGDGAPPSVGAPKASRVRRSVSSRRKAVPALGGLQAWPRTIGGEWIERPEQQRLVAQLTSGRSQGPILLLGGPGSGKSALLAWLEAQMGSTGWAVYAIKADQIPSERVRTEPELCKWLGFEGAQLATALADRAESGSPVLLIVDQLDALASLVDLRTARLNVLLDVIEDVAKLGSIHVVASMRELEAHYDSRLARFRERRENQAVEIRMGDLPEAAVADLWAVQVGIQLAAVPRHLRQPQILKLAIALGRQHKSAAEVVRAFWDDRIGRATKSDRAGLFAITERMDEAEDLWIPAERQRGAALRWVKRGVLSVLERGSRTQSEELFSFAHQSLFELARARAWTEAAPPETTVTRLVLWVVEHQDSLHCRPRLRAILDSIREVPRVHQEAVTQILILAERRLHLRELLAVHIAATETPTPYEKTWMVELLANGEPGVRAAAMAALRGRKGWFRALKVWLEGQLELSDGPTYGYLLSGAWSFDAETIDRWIGDFWSVRDEAVTAALWVLSERPEWSEDAFQLAQSLLRPTTDPTLVSILCSGVRRVDQGTSARLLGRYARKCWDSSSHSRDYTARSAYDVPVTHGWSAAAREAPAALLEELLPGFCRLALRVHDVRGPSGYRDDHADLRYGIQPDQYSDDSPLTALSMCLTWAAKHDEGKFRAAIAALSPIDNELAQRLALRVHVESVPTVASSVVELLCRDARRWRLEPPIAEVLSKLAPIISDAEQARLLGMLESVNRSPPDPEWADAGMRQTIVRRNEDYRRDLAMLIRGEALDDDARERLSSEVSVRVGGATSPITTADLLVMTEGELESALRRYPDGVEPDLGKWKDGFFEGGNIEVAQELESWAAQHPDRATRLLDRLIGAAEAASTEADDDVSEPLKQHRAVSCLIRALGKVEGLSAEVLLVAARAVDAGFGRLGVPGAVDEFRTTVADTVRRLAEEGVRTRDSRLFGMLALWLRQRTYVARPSQELTEDKRLLRESPYTIDENGEAFAVLDAVTISLLNQPRDWRRLIEVLETCVETVDADSWRTLLHVRNLQPVPPDGDKWLEFFDLLCARRPDILAHPDGALVLWRHTWTADSVQVRRWLQLVREARWAAGRRASAELETMLAAVEPHRAWAQEILQKRLAKLPEDDQELLGIAHGLATLWSEAAVRLVVNDWVLSFVARAPEKRVSTFLEALRRGAFRGTPAFFGVLTALRTRSIAWPRRNLYPLGRALLSGLERDPGAVADAALGIASEGPVGQIGGELTSVAFGLQRASDVQVRRKGTELFEMLMRARDYYATQMLQELDEAGTRGA